ncbi:MAG: peptide chain release factor N(5)-glutamine methyltransferase [Bacteroidetes bacterium]|nr:peptide chain release factor N(5)-glutamine methyltransferase [Bacteroidota bacterium]MBL7104802.1 peptide chain release factor N(5)-glutamine methyltransferase [Bacteroidales bacterium]
MGDIRGQYKRELINFYNEKEADVFIFTLFQEFASITKADLIVNPEKTISESKLLKIHFAVKELKNYKPIQYITCKAEFYGMSFSVTPDVLIPRPETEELIEWVIKENKSGKGLKILDIGTGSGCIAIVLKKYMPAMEVYGIDVSAQALQIAQINADMNNADVIFKEVDIFNSGNLPDFDIIVSNPPYVRKSERKQMQRNVLDYEPERALFVEDKNALIFYNAIADFARTHLKENGKLYCEINQYLAKETKNLFQHNGFRNIRLNKDMKRNFRMIRMVK